MVVITIVAITVVVITVVVITDNCFFFSSRLTYTMESNIPYIEIIPENSDVVTGTDVTNEETSFSGMYT